MSINGEEETNSADDFQEEKEEREFIQDANGEEQLIDLSSHSDFVPRLEEQPLQTNTIEENENGLGEGDGDVEKENNQQRHSPLKSNTKTKAERRSRRRRRFILIQDLFPSDEEEDFDDDDDDNNKEKQERDELFSHNQQFDSSTHSGSFPQLADNLHELEVMAEFYATQADLTLLQHSDRFFSPNRINDEDNYVDGHPTYTFTLHAMASDIAKQNYLTHLPETISLSSPHSSFSIQSLEKQITSDRLTAIHKEQATQAIRKVQGYESM